MWKYGYEEATSHRAKQSVTEIREIINLKKVVIMPLLKLRAPIQTRPRFMEKRD